MPMIKKRRVPLGKPITWFPEDEAKADELAAAMATPDAETIELAKTRWQQVKDKFQNLLEAKTKTNV